MKQLELVVKAINDFENQKGNWLEGLDLFENSMYLYLDSEKKFKPCIVFDKSKGSKFLHSIQLISEDEFRENYIINKTNNLEELLTLDKIAMSLNDLKKEIVF